jgi:pimeloyl-ACP methyl ester carboxylesterase
MKTLENRYPLQGMACKHGTLTWREAGAKALTKHIAVEAAITQAPSVQAGPSAQGLGNAPTLVLLHGIGSGALSWAAQLDAFGSTHRVLAWDAPGYGESSPLASHKPLATDYARVLDEWLAHCGVQDVVLVGHSLGALMAAAWAAQRHGTAADGSTAAARLRALVLASPARGYGHTSPAERQAKWVSRLELIDRLGPQRLAQQRAPELCAIGACAAVVELVRWNMARTTRAGYAQAAHLLAFDDLLKYLPVKVPSQAPSRTATLPFTAFITVLCGGLDKVTPPAACQSLAHALGAPLQLLPGVAHPCYVEDPAGFNVALTDCIAQASAAVPNAPLNRHG